MNPPSFKSRGGVARIFKAFRYSMQGMQHAFTHEAAFRQELLLLVPSVAVLAFVDIARLEKLFLVALAVVVLAVEILNSAIEAVVDRISEDPHPLSGRAKDLGSAAVFLVLSLYVVCWLTLVAAPLATSWLK